MRHGSDHQPGTGQRALTFFCPALPPLTMGDQRTLDSGRDDVLAYLRSAQDQQVLVVLNLASSPQSLDLSAAGARGTIHCSTRLDRSGSVNLAYLALRPDEGLVVRVLSAGPPRRDGVSP